MHRTNWIAALAAASIALAPAGGALAQGHCLELSTHVYNGDDAKISNWPGFASLRIAWPSKSGQHICGGVAIAERWVLTAAHCMHPSTETDFMADFTKGPVSADGSGARLQVVLNKANLEQVGATDLFEVEQVILHPRYADRIDTIRKATTGQESVVSQVGMIAIDRGDDIALLRLATDYTGPTTVLSRSGETDPGDGATVFLAGFGKTHKPKSDLPFSNLDGALDYAQSTRLKTAKIFVSPQKECQQIYPGRAVGDGQICAQHTTERKGSCHGDSGGPLVTRLDNNCPIQVGLVSWAGGCSVKGVETVFTRVSHYFDWIEQQTTRLQEPASSLLAPSAQVAPGEAGVLLEQIRGALGEVDNELEISLGGRTAFKDGDRVKFEVKSPVQGRLLLLDLNAEGKIVTLYPNRYAPQSEVLQPGQTVTVPSDTAGFKSFEAGEPYGQARVIGVVFPPDVNLPPVIEEEIVTKSFKPSLEEAQPFADFDFPSKSLTKLVQTIRSDIAAGQSGERRKRWAFAVVEYTVSK